MDPSNTLKGLELAQAKFGPLLSPLEASETEWNNYALNRIRTTKRNEDITVDKDPRFPSSSFPIIRRGIIKRVGELETDMEIPVGSVQKGISVLQAWDSCLMAPGVTEPREAEILHRVYSPMSPSYMDVHLVYRSKPMNGWTDWSYALGYKLHVTPSANAASISHIKKELVGHVSHIHSQHGWRPLVWGLYDGGDDHNLRRLIGNVELGEVGLTHEDTLNICEFFFGTTEDMDEDNEEWPDIINFRTKLVWSIRMLFAFVGIGYRVACADTESDVTPLDWYWLPRWTLEGTPNTWVARGIRRACGFQLTRDKRQEAEFLRIRREQKLAAEEKTKPYNITLPLTMSPAMCGPGSIDDFVELDD